MELMGRYAAANHALIHASHRASARRRRAARYREPSQLRLARAASAARRVRRNVIVHRKGATPAGAGVLGIIPGSMGTPGYVVRGKGRGGVAELRVARRGPPDEPHARRRRFHLGPGAAVPARARRHAALGRPRRSADGLQGHRRGHGRADAISSSRWHGSSLASSRWRPQASGRRISYTRR